MYLVGVDMNIDIKKYIKKLLPRRVYDFLRIWLHTGVFLSVRSYAQQGEDIILNKLIGYKENGFFVDVGAHHPKRFSNTYMFYKRGWEGINVDASPHCIQLLKRKRKRDINVCAAISDETKKLPFYFFEEPALNTFSRDMARKYENKGYKIEKTKMITTHRLVDILQQYLPSNRNIDFLNIDVEGFDLQVLKSNDWARFKPAYVVIEQHGFDIETPKKFDIYNFLIDKGYVLVAKSINTLFFKYDS